MEDHHDNVAVRSKATDESSYHHIVMVYASSEQKEIKVEKNYEKTCLYFDFDAGRSEEAGEESTFAEFALVGMIVMIMI